MPRSAANQAPSGAARIAAPLPHEPCPPNCRLVTARQGSPFPIARSTWCIDGPYPREGSAAYADANKAAISSGSTSPRSRSTRNTDSAMAVSSVHGHRPPVGSRAAIASSAWSGGTENHD